jgi:hypothetical protein
MNYEVKVKTFYLSSLERAFKTPILVDVAQVHTGYGLMPKITYCTEDALWGQIGSTKKVFAAPSCTQKGGYVSTDHVLEREENQYWRIKVDNFQSWMLGFYEFEGIWKTTPIQQDLIQIEYTYILKAKGIALAPLQWLFANTFWKRYMNHVLNNIEKLIVQEEPYKYS